MSKRKKRSMSKQSKQSITVKKMLYAPERDEWWVVVNINGVEISESGYSEQLAEKFVQEIKTALTRRRRGVRGC